ncbi:NAD(P)H-dependent glycerol-3-phosphate dehydrogenase [Pueribacillus theae]|uniref:Glycerol-3-phosphate dehydrogenase [NAD(P)+] n=1 Tax=Pueribacillus theae TaxID=2171751 RepID=A0A2U1K5X9_9BACI|nr:NAD(P)H-dependent glycerol-3-phosphate dehydrogenase [Pueribacillus theae]PWA12383.1 NAD(P)H-dependent glycerol-3-phosphate dehydrogenase [Pueribacillus theae]
MKKIAVLGAGSWGTALAIVLADNGYNVSVWTRRPEQALEITGQKTNKKYLPGINLPENITANTKMEDVINGVDTIVLVTPTLSMREVLPKLNEKLQNPVTIIHASKGIEPDSLKRISEIIEEEVEEKHLKSVVVLSGPSHAEEVSLRQPTTVTVSSKDKQACEDAQDLFINNYFRVYTNQDIIGVEIGGALKNIIALGAGISDGLGHGDNSKAALMTRGLAEITRLGGQLGANPLTFAGLTGIGDLIVTCTSTHSRNWRAGYAIGQGKKLDEVLSGMGMAVEGVRTTLAASQLAERYGVSMPITSELYKVLFKNKNPKHAVDDLMKRDRTHEVEDLTSVFATQLMDQSKENNQ